MEYSTQPEIKKLALLVGGTVIMVVAFSISSNISADALPIATATVTVLPLDRVQVGDSKEDAISTLSEGAWYYADCRDMGLNDAVFFYGPENDRADIVWVKFIIVDGQVKVRDIYELEEDYWLNLLRDCVPKEIIQTQIR